jgi:hypothetical protein
VGRHLGTLLVFLAVLPAVVAARAQETLLEDCLGEGTVACHDSTAILLDESCGERFYNYHGHVAWPVLRYVSPIVISVKTRWIEGTTPFPLYIEVVPHHEPRCTTGLDGKVVMVLQGARQCGGAVESIGPLDLTSFDGIHVGELYYVQAVFFQTLSARYSVPMSCIKIAPAPTGVEQRTWGAVKITYKDVTK